MVDAVNHGGIDIAFAGSGNQHFFGAGIQMDLGFFLAAESAGTFHHQIDIQRFPRQLGRVAGGEEGDFVAVDQQIAAVFFNFGGKAAVHGVKLGQVSVGGQIAAAVDGDDFELVAQTVFVDGADNLTADAAVAVDGDFDRHGCFLDGLRTNKNGKTRVAGRRGLYRKRSLKTTAGYKLPSGFSGCLPSAAFGIFQAA